MLRLEDLPGRVFLDTCVVNFILDHGEEIHEDLEPPASANERVRRDIEALRKIFLVGTRANWQLAISPRTYYEVSQTRDPGRRDELHRWFNEIWQYWCDIAAEDDELTSIWDAEDHGTGLLASAQLDCLPDIADRALISDAVGYRCDLFCTRDWTTILRHRHELSDLPLGIVSPSEWWSRIRPYAALFT